MKPFSFSKQTLPEYGELIERIEVLRSRLRLSSSLDERAIRQILDELNTLRSRMLLMSRASAVDQRFDQATTGGSENRKDSQAIPEQADAAADTETAARRPSARRASYDSLGFEGVLGESPGLLEALEIVRRAAPTDLPILVEGESGTGKELFARVIHANGLRTDKPFVSINCGAIPENLIESELFGHKKGAFTGASSDRKGRFESADGGTIFLDEVGELPLSGQVKLLRVLQSSELQRVGSDQVISIDVRVIAATNRDLASMSAEGGFREDLFYRLGVIHATLPPLRERRDEIPLLLDYYAREAADNLKREPLRLSQSLQTFLNQYHYPGNIRELRNLMYRLSCLADEIAEIRHLPENVRKVQPSTDDTPGRSAPQSITPGTLSEAKKQAGDAAEKQWLEDGLRLTQGSVIKLAKQLEMNRSYLQTLLKKHGIQSKSFKPDTGSRQ